MHTAKPLSEPVTYPECDDVGEHETQYQIGLLLVGLLRSWMASQKRVARVAGNQFWYFVDGDPRQCRAPDVYVVNGVTEASPDRATWKTWEGDRLNFALEVVSERWQKDYDHAPADYAAMKADEVILFDPGATSKSRKRVRWQVYRRVARRGLVKVFAGSGDRVESRALGCWMRLVDVHGNPRLRIGVGPHGDELVPTADETIVVERAAKEAERAAKEAALARVAELEALLARSQRSG